MSTTTITFIVLALLTTLGLSWWMLNRSWGDFSHARMPPPDDSAPGISPERVAAPSEPTGDAQPNSPVSDAATNRILITNPTLLRAAESALYQNSAQARYLVRNGDQLFFAVDRIADPQQRAQAVNLLNRFQTGQHIDMGMAFRLMALLEKG